MVTLTLETRTGGRFYAHLVFTNRGFRNIAEFLRAIGRDASRDVEIEAYDLEGLMPKASVIVDTYEGKLQNKVEKWLPADAANAPLRPRPHWVLESLPRASEVKQGGTPMQADNAETSPVTEEDEGPTAIKKQETAERRGGRER